MVCLSYSVNEYECLKWCVPLGVNCCVCIFIVKFSEWNLRSLFVCSLFTWCNIYLSQKDRGTWVECIWVGVGVCARRWGMGVRCQN